MQCYQCRSCMTSERRLVAVVADPQFTIPQGDNNIKHYKVGNSDRPFCNTCGTRL